MADRALAERIAGLLNELFDADPAAAHALFINRVPCNRAAADHPTIIVDELGRGTGRWTLGPLGLLNGLLAPSQAGDPVLAMHFDDETHALTGFVVVEADRAP